MPIVCVAMHMICVIRGVKVSHCIYISYYVNCVLIEIHPLCYDSDCTDTISVITNILSTRTVNKHTVTFHFLEEL